VVIASVSPTEGLRLRLTGEEKKQLAKQFTENNEAYLLYSLGKYYFRQNTREAFDKSIESFDQAIKIDPNYALAYAGLAHIGVRSETLMKLQIKKLIFVLTVCVVPMSGQPFDVVDSASGSFYFGANSGLSRPNWALDSTRSIATRNVPPGYWFNPFAFVRPVVQIGQAIPSSNGIALAGAQGTDIGNVGRNVLRGPKQINVDFSLIKRFSFAEAKSVELRAEFFNLFNQVNFATPNGNLNAAIVNSNTGEIIDPGDFGRITATSNNPRLIQFALKINF
jgi:hypothetical protein